MENSNHNTHVATRVLAFTVLGLLATAHDNLIPLFGEGKQWHGMSRFRLRGLVKVSIEGLMIAAGQNIKRLLKARPWHKRPSPASPGVCLLPQHGEIPVFSKI